MASTKVHEIGAFTVRAAVFKSETLQQNTLKAELPQVKEEDEREQKVAIRVVVFHKCARWQSHTQVRPSTYGGRPDPTVTCILQISFHFKVERVAQMIRTMRVPSEALVEFLPCAVGDHTCKEAPVHPLNIAAFKS